MKSHSARQLEAGTVRLRMPRPLPVHPAGRKKRHRTVWSAA